jgi:hypothetical protein
MNGKKKLLIPMALLLLFMLKGSVAAANFWEIPLYKADPASKAHGYITSEPIGFIPYERLLHVNVYSLKPGALYDVWIVDRDTGKRTPAGFMGQNTFKTNFGGAGHFTDRTSEFTLGWNKLEVREHTPKGQDPEASKLVLWTWMYQ